VGLVSKRCAIRRRSQWRGPRRYLTGFPFTAAVLVVKELFCSLSLAKRGIYGYTAKDVPMGDARTVSAFRKDQRGGADDPAPFGAGSIVKKPNTYGLCENFLYSKV
jgi:hypothetical protein